MAIDGNATFAVPGCGAPISGPDNLCEEHRLPGLSVRVGDSTMVITDCTPSAAKRPERFSSMTSRWGEIFAT